MPKILCACGRTVDTKPEWGGQWMSCPGCHGTLYAPFPGDKPAPPVPVIDVLPPPPPTLPAPIDVTAPTRLCPWCAETIAVAVASCPFCKADPNTTPATRPATPLPAMSPGVTDSGGWMPLILGIIGFMFCQLLSPVAWAIGSSYEKRCIAKGLKPAGAGTAGKILGIVGTVFLFLILAFMVLSVAVSG